MIYLIDKIKQKNDGTFYLMDACDVEYGDSNVEDALNNVGSTLNVATDEEIEEMLDDIFGSSS